MMQVDSASPPDTVSAGTVELQVPTELDQLVVVRTVAEAVAARENLDLDAVADVKLAVDEASACLISRATLGGRLECRFRLLPHVLEVVVATTTTTPDVPNLNSFGWHILTTLTDTVTVERNRVAPGVYATGIRFTKKRTVGGA
ncbi:MAG: serine/threonine-protein kinase RsbW [Actinomycetota bacterium]|jgi:serine/threonine-protein kinase RsbW|nr:serine/threonine-protein kinase RsbW [Actinomycetota bacterium]